MELLPVRSFFAEALASLYVVSGEKAADQRAREMGADLPGLRSGAGTGLGLDGGSATGGAAGAAGAGTDGVDAAELPQRRVRRFRN